MTEDKKNSDKVQEEIKKQDKLGFKSWWIWVVAFGVFLWFKWDEVVQMAEKYLFRN